MQHDPCLAHGVGVPCPIECTTLRRESKTVEWDWRPAVGWHSYYPKPPPSRSVFPMKPSLALAFFLLTASVTLAADLPKKTLPLPGEVFDVCPGGPPS
jgi:hypothetical protein